MGIEYVIAIGLAIFVFTNAKKRGNNAIGWAIGTFVFWAGVLPVYLSKRYLLAGETREGGTAWNICKYFVMLWTLWWLIVFSGWIMEAIEISDSLTNEYEQAGAGLGMAFGSGVMILLWILPIAGAAIVGFMTKKSNYVENGPTGPMASISTTNS